jgi:hypothetical protein
MKIKFATLFFAIILSFSAYASEDDDYSIMTTFENYRSAILNRDGVKAYSLVDKNTREYYSKSVNRALRLPENETKKLNILDKINVLLARHSIDRTKLSTMNGKTFFIYAVSKGWISEESASKMKIKVGAVNNDFGKSHIITEKGEAPFGFSFRKENGQWKIDLTSIFHISRIAFEQQIKKMDMQENDFLFLVLETNNGIKPSPSVWDPIL